MQPDGTTPKTNEQALSGAPGLAQALAEPWGASESAIASFMQDATREPIADRPAPGAFSLAVWPGEPLEGTRTVTIRDGVATIPIKGLLFHYYAWWTEYFGSSSYETIARDLRFALESPQVKSILLFVDSPGGLCAGCGEAARFIASMRGKKPMVAYVAAKGTSAAYYLAAAADEIVVDPSATIGSIGTVISFLDFSKLMKNIGIEELTFVSSVSPKKWADPKTKEGAAEIQQIVDRLGEVFVEDVAAFRGTTRADVVKNYGQGGILVGADAVSNGLVDRLGSYDELHAELVKRSSTGYRSVYQSADRRPNAAAAAGRRNKMADQTTRELHSEIDRMNPEQRQGVRGLIDRVLKRNGGAQASTSATTADPASTTEVIETGAPPADPAATTEHIAPNETATSPNAAANSPNTSTATPNDTADAPNAQAAASSTSTAVEAELAAARQRIAELEAAQTATAESAERAVAKAAAEAADAFYMELFAADRVLPASRDQLGELFVQLSLDDHRTPLAAAEGAEAVTRVDGLRALALGLTEGLSTASLTTEQVSGAEVLDTTKPAAGNAAPVENGKTGVAGKVVSILSHTATGQRVLARRREQQQKESRGA